MAESIASGILQLVVLATIWLIAVVVVASRPPPAFGRFRSYVVAATVATLPLWIGGLYWYDDLRNMFRQSAAKAELAQTLLAFHRFCETPAEIVVGRPVELQSPTVIRVIEPIATLDIIQSILRVNAGCSNEQSPIGCKGAHVERVQWSFLSDASWCVPLSAENADRCSGMWERALDGGPQTKIERLSAPYVLEVSKSTTTEPKIYRFDVTVQDVASGLVLGKTHFYLNTFTRLSVFSEDNPPRVCPDRDQVVGQLLHGLFPPPKQAQ